ncbi:hypothetical protein [Pelodictyon phaeoclathratiforme]|jgi:enhancing lycopene biosynthesis protein 2|uniref:hypothetical protein n=1 Tax=Pelodictyon phaeoclathratiforme TaxID=34090 RepID=UPI0002EB5FDF|nr:hypothetical protein [Pelodictyon phaeoclathratiforme]
MGARPIECPVGECIVSQKGKRVSTPAAYMLETSIAEVAKGIEKHAGELICLI